MSLRSRILLVALLPLIAFAVQSARLYQAARQEHDIAQAMHDNVLLLDSLSQTIHELQKERGISSLFASGGSDSIAVGSQRRRSDAKLASLQGAVGRSTLPTERLATLAKALDDLPQLRRSTDVRSDPAEIRKGYTRLIRSLLGGYKLVIAAPSTKGVGKLVTSFAILEEAKEATGRLRALSSSLLALDKPLGVEPTKQLLELHSAIEGNLASPGLALGGEAQKALEKLENSPSTLETERVFWTLIEKASTGGYGVSGKACFDAYTRRIDELQDFLRPLYAAAGERTLSLHDDTEVTQLWAIVSGIAVGAILLLLVVLTLRDLSRRMSLLRGIVERASRGDLSAVPGAAGSHEFDILQTAMRSMVSRMDDLIGQMKRMAAEHDRGEIDASIDGSRFEGAFREMAEGVNGMVFGHIAVKKKAMACVSEFGRGNFDAPLERFPGKKAFINQTIEDLRGNLKAISGQVGELIEASKAGRLNTRGDAKRFAGDWSLLVAGVNEMLDAILLPIQEAAKVLDQVASRDLTARVQGDYQGDHAKIKQSLNLAIKNLEEAMSQVLDSSQQVAGASGQISSGSQSLAQGANEQASSLEEVSASLEEMSSMTRQNADNALSAKNLAAEADGNAKTGSEAMTRMSVSITRIKESSDQTAKIVKTIDEIAMQTNLLALNAAVEAARAGEAGRGFAVVAEEVRNLAQRSAQAAKSTADMIGESVRNAEDGVRISEEVSSSFTKIATSSKKVNELIAEIAVASKEQAAGIKEVTDAVSQMDKVTQQNAANAEESASASEELSSQAQELAAMVGQFRIAGSSSGGAGRPGPVAQVRRAALPGPSKPVTGSAGRIPGRAVRRVEADEVIPMGDDALREF